MPKFIVNNTFQFGGDIRQAGSVLTISKADLEKELAKGKHPKRGTWLSGLLNHCEPEDDAAAELIAGEIAEEESEKPEDDAAAEADVRLAEIREEMDKMGAAWDRRWKLPRMENELVMAKKVRGE